MYYRVSILSNLESLKEDANFPYFVQKGKDFASFNSSYRLSTNIDNIKDVSKQLSAFIR
jgi:hypothetical protein